MVCKATTQIKSLRTVRVLKTKMAQLNNISLSFTENNHEDFEECRLQIAVLKVMFALLQVTKEKFTYYPSFGISSMFLLGIATYVNVIKSFQKNLTITNK